MYLIEHVYDVDGGFGDAIGNTDVIGAMETMEEAIAYVAKWSHPVVYDVPYAPLEHKALRIREVKKLNINEDPFGDGDPYLGYNYQKNIEEGEYEYERTV